MPPQGARRAAYLKCTTRSADDWPALGVAVSLDDATADARARRAASVVIGAATDRPTRLAAAEAVLRGGARGRRDARAGGRRGGGGGRRSSATRTARRPTRSSCSRLSRARAVRAALGVSAMIASDARPSETRTGRPLGSAPRRPGQGDRARRVRPQPAPAGDAARQDLPQHGRARRASRIDTQRRARGRGRAPRRHRRRTSAPSSPTRITARPSTISRSSRSTRCATSASRSRVVLAADPHVAEEAAGRIVVEYEELPAVYDEVEAMTSKAIVHDVLKPAGTFPDLKHLQGRKNTNIALDYHLRRGDAEAAFAAGRPRVRAHVPHAAGAAPPLEPFVSVAEPGDGTLTIHTASQSPSFVRIEIARLLGWPENKVRVKVPYLGGGFGAKLYIKLEALVAAAALLTRAGRSRSRSRWRSSSSRITKHAATVAHQERRDEGRAHHGARSARCGGTAAPTPTSARASRRNPASPRPAPTTSRMSRIDSYALYTNLPPAGALRGFGIPQLVWAYESHTDMIARELEARPGRVPPQEHPARRPPAGDRHRHAGRRASTRCSSASAARMDWEQAVRPRQRHRSGAAAASRSASRPASRRRPRSRSSISTPTAAARSIAAPSTWARAPTPRWRRSSREVLGIPAESITVVHPDTDVTPYDMATLGSRSTYPHGPRRAARGRGRARQAAGAGAGSSACSVGDRPPIARRVPEASTACRRATSSAPAASSRPTRRPTTRPASPPNVTPFWMIGATGAEVEVDTETGHVTRRRGSSTSPTSARRSIRRSSRRQLSGAAIMQFGFTHVREDGVQRRAAAPTPSLADYKIPGMLDIPADDRERGGGRRAGERPVRRQGRRRERDVRRVAGDRQCDRGRGRRAPDRAAAHRRGGVSRAARKRPASR